MIFKNKMEFHKRKQRIKELMQEGKSHQEALIIIKKEAYLIRKEQDAKEEVERLKKEQTDNKQRILKYWFHELPTAILTMLFYLLLILLPILVAVFCSVLWGIFIILIYIAVIILIKFQS